MPRGKEPSWSVQKLIFELLVRHGNHPVVIQRSLDALINQSGLAEDTPGINWIRMTVARLQELPLDVLAELSPSVWKKRHDYNTIRDELERLVGETKGEPKTEQQDQIERYIGEARHQSEPQAIRARLNYDALAKHLEEVEDAIRWQKEGLKERSPESTPFPPELDSLPAYIPNSPRLPLDKLDTHVPQAVRGTLWDRKKKRDTYQEGCCKLLKGIEEEAKRRTELDIERSIGQPYEPCLTHFFGDLIYIDICRRASGSPLGALGDKPDYKYRPDARAQGLQELWVSNKCVAVGLPEQMQRCHDVHKKMLLKYRKSGKAVRLNKLYHELKELDAEVEADLEQVLLTRSYVGGQCGFCANLGSIALSD